jgi:aminoglycoside/choline kinase family phosphotransferase
MFLEERRVVGLPEIDVEEFTAEFRLMTIQRVLKAIGTFSFQAGVKGRLETYLKYINPMLSVALQAAELLGRFPVLQEVITARKSDSYERVMTG